MFPNFGTPLQQHLTPAAPIASKEASSSCTSKGSNTSFHSPLVLARCTNPSEGTYPSISSPQLPHYRPSPRAVVPFFPFVQPNPFIPLDPGFIAMMSNHSLSLVGCAALVAAAQNLSQKQAAPISAASPEFPSCVYQAESPGPQPAAALNSSSCNFRKTSSFHTGLSSPVSVFSKVSFPVTSVPISPFSMISSPQMGPQVLKEPQPPLVLSQQFKNLGCAPVHVGKSFLDMPNLEVTVTQLQELSSNSEGASKNESPNSPKKSNQVSLGKLRLSQLKIKIFLSIFLFPVFLCYTHNPFCVYFLF
jgi:hypothetical protein